MTHDLRRAILSRLCALALPAFLGVAPRAAVAQDADLDSVAWLAGCWTSQSGDTTTDEVWLAPRGGMMVGVARSVRGETAIGYELLVLRRIDSATVFTAYPSGQQPADFEVVASDHGLLRVENPDHDFPQKLEYRLHGADALVAGVFAAAGDVVPAFEVAYARGECPR